MSGQAVSIDWNLDVDSLADQLLLGKTQAERLHMSQFSMSLSHYKDSVHRQP